MKTTPEAREALLEWCNSHGTVSSQSGLELLADLDEVSGNYATALEAWEQDTLRVIRAEAEVERLKNENTEADRHHRLEVASYEETLAARDAEVALLKEESEDNYEQGRKRGRKEATE